jgi:hypothetical protein
MYGSGSKIAGIRISKARQPMAVFGKVANVQRVLFAVGHGVTIRHTRAQDFAMVMTPKVVNAAD